MPMAKTLPRPAASWLAAPVKVASVVVVVAVLLDLVVADVAIVVATEELAGAEVVTGAAEEAELAEETGATELAGTDEAELEPPALSAAQAAWAFVRVAAASVEEHFAKTQLVAALWMAASFADSH